MTASAAAVKATMIAVRRRETAGWDSATVPQTSAVPTSANPNP
jgi:hypothetical protein